MRTINKKQLMDIAHGACFLGSGGGGPLELIDLFIQHMLPDDMNVQIVSVDEAAEDEDALTAVVSFIGAPARGGSTEQSMGALPMGVIPTQGALARGGSTEQSMGTLPPKVDAVLNAFDGLNDYCKSQSKKKSAM